MINQNITKSILLIGKKNAGKSTTMREVSKRLAPTKVEHLRLIREGANKIDECKRTTKTVNDIRNGIYLIEVEGKLILVVAGSATELGITIISIIDFCIQKGIEFSFVLATMRSKEKKEGFETKRQLAERTEIIHEERIIKIRDEGKDFMKNNEWINRINKIVDIVKLNVLR